MEIPKIERILFVLILLFGAFLRLYRLPETMQFLGDQGRDALIARAILIDHDPAFIGPVTSVGNMYLGPLYYYFMVFPLMLSYPSPVGPAYAVAIIGILTLGLLYILGKEMIGKRAAMIAMLLYAVSPVVIAGVRFSWNPNIVPFFSLMFIWSAWKARVDNYRYWMLAGICGSALFQLHYIALILIGAVGLLWIEQLFQAGKKKEVWQFLVPSVIAVLIFLVSLVPLALFDLKHDYLNSKAFLQFFHPSISSERHFRQFSDISGNTVSFVSMTTRILIEFFGIHTRTFGQKLIIALLGIYVSIRVLIQSKGGKRRAVAELLFLLIISILLLSMYSSSVFDHYVGFVLPMSFLALGVFLSSLSRSIFLIPLTVMVLAVFSLMSMRSYPGFVHMDGNIFDLTRASELIVPHIPKDGSYQLLSYAPSKDLQAMNYRYLLTARGKSAAHPDDWISSKYLVVIDEEHRGTPFDESQYVIKIWPNREIMDQFTVPNGPDVYILRR